MTNGPLTCRLVGCIFLCNTDGSRRAFYREFARVVESSDVILHVLDARDPLGCRCVDVERYIVKRNPDKKIVLMLNKIGQIPSAFHPDRLLPTHDKGTVGVS